MAVDLILSRLEKVRKGTGHNTWLACCPAHDDKSPSLAVRELDDGRVLLHCFASCCAEEVLVAVDLDMAALFSGKPTSHVSKPECRPFSVADALRAIWFEGLVIHAAGNAMLSGEFTEGDRVRLNFAVSRVGAALDTVGVTL